MVTGSPSILISAVVGIGTTDGAEDTAELAGLLLTAGLALGLEATGVAVAGEAPEFDALGTGDAVGAVAAALGVGETGASELEVQLVSNREPPRTPTNT